MSESNQILIVEDEESIREPLAAYLSENGYRVREAGNAAEARKLMAVYHFNLIILDIMMPGEDGISLCRHIRETYNTPTIMLTAKTEEIDRIVGLEVGADDYVPKPFSPRELLARMHAVLRRSQEAPRVRSDAQNLNFSFGHWILNTAEQVLVDADGVNISLSTGEYNLLHAMVTRPNRVLSREQLLDLSQGRDAEHFDRSIDNMISRLRRKVEVDPKKPKVIKTVWGGGYSFNSDVREV
jgi:two-component system OmpR family response regulator